MQHSVQIKNLSLGFGAVKILENLNLDVGQGEFIVLLGAAGNAHPFSTDAEIEIVEPMGSDTLGWTKIGKTPAIFRVDSEIDLKVGQKLRIGFDPARGSLFHAESGERL
jgi:ABC-type sugar transport system ATPase subunit